MIYMHFYNILLTLYYDMTAETFEYAMKNGREWTIDPFPSTPGYISIQFPVLPMAASRYFPVSEVFTFSFFCFSFQIFLMV